MKKIALIDSERSRREAMKQAFGINTKVFLIVPDRDFKEAHLTFDVLLVHASEAGAIPPDLSAHHTVWYGGSPARSREKASEKKGHEAIGRSITGKEGALTESEAQSLMEYLAGNIQRPHFLNPNGYDPKKEAIIGIIDQLVALPEKGLDQERYNHHVSMLCAGSEACFSDSNAHLKKVQQYQPKDTYANDTQGWRAFFKAIAEVRDDLFKSYYLL